MYGGAKCPSLKDVGYCIKTDCPEGKKMQFNNKWLHKSILFQFVGNGSVSIMYEIWFDIQDTIIMEILMQFQLVVYFK